MKFGKIVTLGIKSLGGIDMKLKMDKISRMSLCIGLLGLLVATRGTARPGQTTSCTSCHAYPATNLDVSTDVTSVTVAPGNSFTVNISWTGGATDRKTEVNWALNSQDNSLFIISPQIPSPGAIQPSGLTSSVITAPASAGIYSIRVFAADGSSSASGLSKETDYVNITVTVEEEVIDEPPVANAGPNQTVNVGDTVFFDGTSSSDDVGIDLYEWDFNSDGSYDDNGATVSTVYNTAGTYTVTLRVTDTAGQTDTDTCTVTVEEAGPPVVSAELVKKSAWPEHSHFDISKDEDEYLTLYGLVQNTGEADISVWVEFNIYDESGGLVAMVDSQTDTLTPGAEMVLSGDWIPPQDGGKYFATALAVWNDGAGSNVRSFKFSVVP